MASAFLNSVLLFELPGGFEWIVIIAVVILLFGGRKIPELMRGLGRGIREFNDAKTNVKKEIEEGMKESNQEDSATETSAPHHQVKQQENA